MPVRVSNLRMGIDRPEASLPEQLGRVLGLKPDEFDRWRILRKSLDARDSHSLHFVYAAEVSLPWEEARLTELARKRSRGEVRVEVWHEQPYLPPTPGIAPLTERPIVIGSGPGGLVAAYFLARQG